MNYRRERIGKCVFFLFSLAERKIEIFEPFGAPLTHWSRQGSFLCVLADTKHVFCRITNMVLEGSIFKFGFFFR